MLGRGLDAVLAQRDLVLFDQRGTGYSQPRLDCPERSAVTPALLDGSLSAEQAQGAIVEAFRRCRERLLAQGIDLSAYNSAASAADLNDLRLALGYEKLNLYAVSYGTRLALTLMRDYPQAVRSAVTVLRGRRRPLADQSGSGHPSDSGGRKYDHPLHSATRWRPSPGWHR
jgi:pimeloyl-ACP methyl ester carboxylesterase